MTPIRATIDQPQTRTTDTDPFRYGWRHVRQQDESGNTVVVQVPLRYEDLLHPEEEDKVVQNPDHDRACAYLRTVLLLAMDGHPDTEVFHDVRIDWGQEDVKPHCPDLAVFVNVRGSFDRKRTFYAREVGARPALVLEVTSPSTRSLDLVEKVVHYHLAGVPIYALFDFPPEEEDRPAQVLGYRATPEGYVRIPTDAHGRLWLEPVKRWLAAEGDQPVCYDEEGIRIPDARELNRELRQADARNEELRTQVLEAIAERQKAQIHLAEEARQRKAAEEAALIEARHRKLAEETATTLAARLADLEARLQQSGGLPGSPT